MQQVPNRIARWIAGLFLICPAFPTLAATATFENFSEGQSFSTSFTDPLSGIFFSNPTALNHDFVIEYGGPDPQLPDITPGHYLKSNGYAPGDGISVSPNTGFTATLPSAALLLSMDFVYISPGTLTVNAFDAQGNIVATQSVTPPPGNFLEGHLALQSPSPFVKFTATSTVDGIGYDNIHFDVPEPSTLGPVATILLGLRCRRWRVGER
ncbi:MAG TPA: hypothetical protein VHS31_16390 [Tepidisphaeraceae bacterium]|jgi:hypothetical protein|nr:hypothetical protein [Tepidisphaeraceae bacterium]